MNAQHRTVHVAGQAYHLTEQGRGQPILLVHGFPLDHSMWAHQLSGLSGTHRVLAPDLPGCGRNEPVHGIMTMSAAADHLAAILDHLQLDQPVVYCGLSMGGYIGWEFYHRHRRRVSHLIMCDTRAAADSDDVARGREMMAAQVEREGPAAVAETMIPKLFAAPTLTANDSVVAATRAVIDATAGSSIAAYQRGMASRVDFGDRLGELDLPTLFICGAADTITPAAELAQLSQTVPGAIYAEISDAGHLAPLEQPLAVNRAIRDFLA